MTDEELIALADRCAELADCDARAGEPLGRCLREAAASIRALVAERGE